MAIGNSFVVGKSKAFLKVAISLPFYNVRTQYSGIEFLSVCVFKLKPALFAQKQGASPFFPL
jgi:hypothetical protein